MRRNNERCHKKNVKCPVYSQARLDIDFTEGQWVHGTQMSQGDLGHLLVEQVRTLDSMFDIAQRI